MGLEPGIIGPLQLHSAKGLKGGSFQGTLSLPGSRTGRILMNRCPVIGAAGRGCLPLGHFIIFASLFFLEWMYTSIYRDLGKVYYFFYPQRGPDRDVQHCTKVHSDKFPSIP